MDINSNDSRIDDAFQRQSQYFLESTPLTLKERIELLKKLKTEILLAEFEIKDAAFQDMKKPTAEVDLSEIMPVITEINHAIRYLKKWTRPKKVRSTLKNFGSKSKVFFEPKGIVLIISPWNFPINLTLGPLVSAIAAGNTVVIKPSELSPNLSACLSKIVNRCFNENQVTIFEGGVDVASYLLSKPFDHVFFTGSPKVGRIVMESTAKHNFSVTLELGGKSPVIIGENANLKYAAKKIAWGKFFNNGQICMAPDYVYVPEHLHDDFIKEIKASIKTFYGEAESIKYSQDYGRIVNTNHWDRIVHLVDQSCKKGANILFGGEKDRENLLISPTVIGGADLDSPLMKEEIFGPVLPVLKYHTFQDLYEGTSSLSKPLALYIFDDNQRFINKVLSNIRSGTVCINDVIVQFLHPNLPFGGVGASGFGGSHGYYGFKEFSHERAYMKQAKINSIQYLYPPYTNFVKAMIQKTVKYF